MDRLRLTGEPLDVGHDLKEKFMKHIYPLMAPSCHSFLEPALKAALVGETLAKEVMDAMAKKPGNRDSSMVFAASLKADVLENMPIEQLQALAACAEKYCFVARKTQYVRVIFACEARDIVLESLKRRCENVAAGENSNVAAGETGVANGGTGAELRGERSEAAAEERNSQPSEEEDAIMEGRETKRPRKEALS